MLSAASSRSLADSLKIQHDLNSEESQSQGVVGIFCFVGFGGAFWVCFGVWFCLLYFGFPQRRNMGKLIEKEYEK